MRKNKGKFLSIITIEGICDREQKDKDLENRKARIREITGPSRKTQYLNSTSYRHRKQKNQRRYNHQ